jgi:hypothetical protein
LLLTSTKTTYSRSQRLCRTTVNPISNVHEAEFMLRSLGCDDRGIQRAMAWFLSVSTPEYDSKTRTFVIGASDGKGRNCLPKDIFDQDAAKAGAELAPATKQAAADIDPSVGMIPKYREIGFDFQIRDSDAAKRFFAPLPDWYAEALQRNIEVGSVPDWMKPGEPPATWSFTAWLDSRSFWLILAAGMLGLSVLCLVVASRINKATTGADSSVGGV